MDNSNRMKRKCEKGYQKFVAGGTQFRVRAHLKFLVNNYNMLDDDLFYDRIYKLTFNDLQYRFPVGKGIGYEGYADLQFGTHEFVGSEDARGLIPRVTSFMSHSIINDRPYGSMGFYPEYFD